MGTPQTSRFHDLLRRLTLSRDLSYPAVLDDLFPVLDLLADKPELLRGRGELPFSIGVGAAAAPALVNRLWLMNKQPGNLCVITHLLASSLTAQDIVADIVNTGLPADVVNLTSGLDSRNADSSGTIRTRVTMGADTAGAAIAAGFRVSIGALPVVIPLRVVLSPGFAFRVTGITVNTTLVVDMMGYERSVDPVELT